jgi:hypothetical protein
MQLQYYISKFIGQFHKDKESLNHAHCFSTVIGTGHFPAQSRLYAPEPQQTQTGAHISAPTRAIIKNHQLLGNVIRYQVRANQYDITVDLLNRSSERLLDAGTPIGLLFNLNELQHVS